MCMSGGGVQSADEYGDDRGGCADDRDGRDLLFVGGSLRAAADEVHDGFLVVDADGDGGFAEFDGVAVDGSDMADCYEVAAVDSDELARGKGFFEIVHGLVGDECIFRGMDLQIVFHTFYINDLGEVYFKKFAVALYKNMIMQ